jgi:hypothetical protein
LRKFSLPSKILTIVFIFYRAAISNASTIRLMAWAA